MPKAQTTLAVFLLAALGGCAFPDQPPPALPGTATIEFVALAQIPAACNHIASPWIVACTRMDHLGRPIVLPLPQDYPGDEYARIIQFELAHAQQNWPDPPEIRDRLIGDAIKSAF